MAHIGDQDGKSKTASAVDEQHYPPVRSEDHEPPEPTHAEIAARAHQLWLEGDARKARTRSTGFKRSGISTIRRSRAG
jgi:hypothetical protein